MWLEIAGGNEDNIYQSPHTKTAETEQFTESFLPVAEIEPVHTEAAQCNAEKQCRGPFIIVLEFTFDKLFIFTIAQTEHIFVCDAGGSKF